MWQGGTYIRPNDKGGCRLLWCLVFVFLMENWRRGMDVEWYRRHVCDVLLFWSAAATTLSLNHCLNGRFPSTTLEPFVHIWIWVGKAHVGCPNGCSQWAGAWASRLAELWQGRELERIWVAEQAPERAWLDERGGAKEMADDEEEVTTKEERKEIDEKGGKLF